MNNKCKIIVTDIDGIPRGKYVSKKKFESIKKDGINFCSVIFGWDSRDICYTNGVEFTGWHTGYHDINGEIDLYPWKLPSLNKEIYIGYFPKHMVCPRNLLINVIKDTLNKGFYVLSSFEYEWFNFLEDSHSIIGKTFNELKPLTPGSFGYSAHRLSKNSEYVEDIMKTMDEIGVNIEGFHTETGPGVFEVALEYCDSLKMTDMAVIFKMMVKEIGLRHGILATFMSKISDKLAGSGCHIHQSLWSSQEIEPCFNYDENKEHGMSVLMKQYLAGQLYCLPHILPMYAPNINSYKRLVDGCWAPTRVGWGIENRTTTHRVIIDKFGKGTRIECRVAGADTNPYLVMAASIASGIYGITNKLELPPIVIDNAYEDNRLHVLSNNLLEATKKMKESHIPYELFGKEFVDHYVKTREWEWEKFNESITDWETKRYLEII